MTPYVRLRSSHSSSRCSGDSISAVTVGPAASAASAAVTDSIDCPSWIGIRSEALMWAPAAAAVADSPARPAPVVPSSRMRSRFASSRVARSSRSSSSSPVGLLSPRLVS